MIRGEVMSRELRENSKKSFELSVVLVIRRERGRGSLFLRTPLVAVPKRAAAHVTVAARDDELTG